MAFTYSSAPNTSTRDRIRLAIGDTKEDDGPRPDKGNYSDQELDAFYLLHSHWECVVAAVYEALAAEWIPNPVFGPGELSTVHTNNGRLFRDMAIAWRERCMEASASGGLGYAEILDASGAGTGLRYEPIFQREEFGLGETEAA